MRLPMTPGQIQAVEGTVTRAAKVAIDGLDEETRTFTLSFSSDTPYLRDRYWDQPWLETLGHKSSEVDLARLNDGAPLLYNHSRSRESRVGVVEKAWIKEGKGYATVRLSRHDRVDDLWRDLVDGVLRNVSVGYQIKERKLTKQGDKQARSPDEYRVTRWLPMEISLVDIPADQTVGVARSENYRVIDIRQEGKPDMPPETAPQQKTDTPDAGKSDADQPETPPLPDLDAARSEGESQAMKRLEIRNGEVRAVFKPFGDRFRDFESECLADPTKSVDQVRAELLKKIGEGAEPLGGDAAHQIRQGKTEMERFVDGAGQALLVRAGLEKLDQKDGNDFRGFTLLELARRCVELSGGNTRGMDKMALVGRAITSSGGDFPNLLAGTARKAMLRGYEESGEVFQEFVRIGNLGDFKSLDLVGLSAFGDLEEIKPNDEYRHGRMSDRKESIQLTTYGKMFNLSRQMVINDDLNGFTAIPRAMGRAAHRKVGDLVFSIFNNNPAMADGTALFHAAHANLLASGTAISAASVGAAKTAMRKQTDPSGNAVLNIRPAHFLVPPELEDTAQVLMTSEFDPSKTQRTPNPARGLAKVVTDARLTDADAWYFLASAQQFDTILVGYLDGNPNPYLEEKEGWTVDGVEMKVRIDAAAKALDHRTMYKNPGA